ncbi:S-adenosyl-L-methionine-dependent methyltransferase [Phytophthora cactorum]|nr:S-adenosyl-L-methionine-dependent methyltransferase [Phytophthora cactorum]
MRRLRPRGGSTPALLPPQRYPTKQSKCLRQPRFGGSSITLITEILEPASSPPIVEPSLWPPISPPRTEPQALPLSSSSAKEVVAESFEDVPRELVLAYDGHSIHKNVGEVPPAGISILLSELGASMIATYFGLSTNIYRAVGIEAQEQVQTAGIQAINKSLYARAFRDRAPFICKYIRDIRLASTSPFAEVTIVYWNNVVFKPSVTEHVKQQLQDMADVRIQLSCVNFYRRHRVLCFNHFCTSFSFKKVVEVPCSWKSDLLAVYIYNSTYNE